MEWSARIDVRRLCWCFHCGDLGLPASYEALALLDVAGDPGSASQPRNDAFAPSGARIPTSSFPTAALLVLAPEAAREVWAGFKVLIVPVEHIGVYSSALLWRWGGIWKDWCLQVALYERSTETTLAHILMRSTSAT